MTNAPVAAPAARPESPKVQGLVDAAIIAGLAAGILYPVGLLGLVPGRLSDIAFMLFGPCFAISVFGLRAFHARASDSAINDLAHLMLVIAGVAHAFMAAMQMSIHSQIPRFFREAGANDPALWDAILRSVSSTQLGLDFAFDIFVSLGAILLGWQMIRHPRIPGVAGLAGILVGAGGLAANMAAFPLNPEEAGLIDPAPFFGVWFGLVWLPLVFLRRWRPQEVRP